jgi:diguanylate cyclase
MASMSPLTITYVYWLVAISLLTSIVASYAAFSFAERIADSTGARFWIWLIGGASAMGLGIWSMHYLGMLAVKLPVEVSYHVPTVVLSFFMAVAASTVALATVSRKQISFLQIAAGGVLMGGAIGAMHYTGMAAMRSTAMHHYNPAGVVLSMIVAVVFSWMALWISFSARSDHKQREWQRLGGAVLMGSGIAAMHYTGMSAVTFVPAEMLYSPIGTIRVSTLGVLAVALTTAVVLIGALTTAILDQRTYRILQEAHSNLANAQAALIQTEFALRMANLQLKELTIRDGLTKAFNRRHFDASLEAETKRAARTKLPLSLLMIDVDYFKALNDRYGHLAGDECLQKIAHALSAMFSRPEDVVARYGGEEFAIILPGANSSGASTVAQLVRNLVEDLKIPNEDSPIGKFVTVSIGTHTRVPAVGESPADIIAAADAALYEAKTSGRNSVHAL